MTSGKAVFVTPIGERPEEGLYKPTRATKDVPFAGEERFRVLASEDRPSSRSVNHSAPRLRTTLAHLPPTRCSTAYCSRTVAFLFLAPALMLASEQLSVASCEGTPDYSERDLALRVRTLETSSCLYGARRTRTLDLRNRRVKQIHALSCNFFCASCGQAPNNPHHDLDLPQRRWSSALSVLVLDVSLVLVAQQAPFDSQPLAQGKAKTWAPPADLMGRSGSHRPVASHTPQWDAGCSGPPNSASDGLLTDHGVCETPGGHRCQQNPSGRCVGRSGRSESAHLARRRSTERPTAAVDRRGQETRRDDDQQLVGHAVRERQ